MLDTPQISEQPAGSRDQTAPRRSSRRLVAALVAAAMIMGLGIWFRWPIVTYDGPQNLRSFNIYELQHHIYSDIATFYYRLGLWRHPVPARDYGLSYPVGIALLLWVSSALDSLRAYFLANSFFLAACGLAITALIPRFPRGQVWWFALSPGLALYVNLNWDLWGILPMVVALLLFSRGHRFIGTAVLALAVWTKFFPIVFLPLIFIDSIQKRRWEEAGLMAVIFGLVSIAVNAPALLASPENWFDFFRYNIVRPREANLWAAADPVGINMHTGALNALLALLLVTIMAGAIWLLWRRPRAFLLICCAVMTFFFFANKNYSAQYNIWVTTMLAISGANVWLAVAWAVADVLYFVAGNFTSFNGPLGLSLSFPRSSLLWATGVKEVVSVGIIIWCVRRAWRCRGDATAPASRDPSIGRSEQADPPSITV